MLEAVSSGDRRGAWDCAIAAEEAQWDVDMAAGRRGELDAAQERATHPYEFARLAARARAADLLAAERKKQQGLMPPQESWSSAGRAAVATARERLAYASTHAAVSSDDERQMWADDVAEHQRTVRQLSAEWGFPVTKNGATGPLHHCPACGRFVPNGATGHLGCRGARPVGEVADEWSGLVDDDSAHFHHRRESLVGELTASESWRMVASAPDRVELAQFGCQYMAAHGQMQCDSCGHWVAVRYGTHTCPPVADHLPVQAGWGVRGAAAAAPPADGGLVGVREAVSAADGSRVGFVVEQDVPTGDGGVMHAWYAVGVDESRSPFAFSDPDEAADFLRGGQ